jgi:hypothetical protein
LFLAERTAASARDWRGEVDRIARKDPIRRIDVAQQQALLVVVNDYRDAVAPLREFELVRIARNQPNELGASRTVVCRAQGHSDESCRVLRW